MAVFAQSPIAHYLPPRFGHSPGFCNGHFESLEPVENPLHPSVMQLRYWIRMVMLPPGLFAQGVSPQADIIRTTVPIVVLPVSVTDPQGHFVYGLQALISFFSIMAGPVPSTSMNPAPVSLRRELSSSFRRPTAQGSALLKIQKTGAVVQQAVLGAKGEAAIIAFSDTVDLVQDFTGDADQLSDAFHDLKRADTGQGRMLDALAKALDMLSKKPVALRSSILIIGETKDRGSQTKLNQLLPRIERSAVIIDALVYSAYLTPFTTKGADYDPPESGGLIKAITETARLRKPNASTILTTATGGRRLRFETLSKLENDLIYLGSDIHSRYLLSFTPQQEQPATFHSVLLKVRNQPKLTIRTRPGYWSDLHD